jgi:hypothetical protein
MPSQLTNSILMVSPDTFGYNNQTAISNSFQRNTGESLDVIRKKAMGEFKNMVDTLNNNGVDVFVLGNDSEEDLPDAVFPNNWLATYEDGTVILFPMLTENRRLERQADIIEGILEPAGFKSTRMVDLTHYESRRMILEGTGSLVLDRKNNIVYAIESERTTREMFDEYCSLMNVPNENRIFFHADDERGEPIYHTNVIMSVGDGFAVVCDECISSWNERNEVINKLEANRIEVIRINYKQLNSFCGNLLNVKSYKGASLIVMSENAYKAFTPQQITTLEKYGKIIAVNIDTIEKIGGGSARCMMAEIFLPKSE